MSAQFAQRRKVRNCFASETKTIRDRLFPIVDRLCRWNSVKCVIDLGGPKTVPHKTASFCSPANLPDRNFFSIPSTGNLMYRSKRFISFDIWGAVSSKENFLEIDDRTPNRVRILFHIQGCVFPTFERLAMRNSQTLLKNN